MSNPEQLIHDHLDDALTAAGQDALHAWLMEDAAHMQRFTKALMFDEEIRRAVHAKEGRDSADRFTGSAAPLHPPTQSDTIPFKPIPKTSHRLARAAAWLGAFTWFGSKAQAAGTATTTAGSLLSIKTAGTAALLLVGGGSLYLIRQDNQATSARIEQLQARRDAILKTTAEGQATRTPIKSAVTTPEPADPNIVYLDKLAERLANVSDMREWGLATEGMDAMDLEALTQLLIVAQESPLHSSTLPAILDKMGERFPAEATMLAAEISASHSTFHKGVSNQLGNNFVLWMKADRKAAEQWYSAVMASGELMPKSIPGPEEEPFMPERILAKHRFEALWDSDPEQVVSMVGVMREDDVAHVLSHWPMETDREDTDTGFLSRIVTQLSPERQDEALRGHVFALAVRDFTKASEWLDGVVASETVHAKLLIHATRVAYSQKKLSQSAALEILGGLPESPEREDARRRIERN